MAKKINPLSIDPNTGLNIVEESDIQSFQAAPETYYGGLSGIGEARHDEHINIGEAQDDAGYLNKYRADAQTGWELAGKAIGQGAVEATLGAAEGIGYALDFEELYNSDKQAEEGFDNWFSRAIRDTKENIQEDVFGIYQSEQAQNGTLGQKMSDGTWWAAQGKTMGTTLSLMIPSVGVGRAVGMLGKLGRAGRLAGKASKAVKAGDKVKDAYDAAMKAEGLIQNILSGVAAGAFSRKAESAMEANQKFQEAYEWWKNSPDLQKELLNKYTQQVESIDSEIERISKTLINPAQENAPQLEAQRQAQLSSLMEQRNSVKGSFDTDLEGQARLRAGEEASKVFKANALMAPIDMMQYALLMKPFSGIKGAIDAAKKSTTGKIIGTAIAQPVSEGLEEGYQFVAGEEASASVREDKDMFGEGFSKRMSEYAKDPHFHESVALGAMMGLVFNAGGTAIQKVAEKFEKDSKETVQSKDEPEYRSKVNKATSTKIMDDFKLDNKGIVEGRSEQSISELEDYKEQVNSNEELTDDIKQETISNIDSYIDKVKYVNEQDSAIKDDPRFQNVDVRSGYLEAKLEDKIYSEELTHSTTMLENELGNSGLDSNKAAMFQADIELKQLTKVKNEILKENKLTADEKASLNEYINSEKATLKSTVSALEKSQQEIEPNFKVKKLSSSNTERVTESTKARAKNKAMKEGVLPTKLSSFTNMTPEVAQELSKKAEAKGKAEMESFYKAQSKSKNTPEELRQLNGEIKQKFPNQFQDIIDSNENKAKSLDSKKQTAELKTRESFSKGSFNTQIANSTTKEELLKLKDDLSTFNPSRKVKSELNTNINKKIASLGKAPKETAKVESVKISPKVGGLKGQTIDAQLVGGSYIAKNSEGIKVSFTPKNVDVIEVVESVEDQPKGLFDDSGEFVDNGPVSIEELEIQDAKAQQVGAEEVVTSESEILGDVEAQKADIEDRRQSEIDRRTHTQKTMEQQFEDNLDNNQEMIFKIGTELTESDKISYDLVQDETSDDFTGEPIKIVIRTKKPTILTDGVLSQSGRIDVGLFESKDAADKWLAERDKRNKQSIVKKTNEINAKYDAELSALTNQATKETELINSGIEPNSSTEKIVIENSDTQVEDVQNPIITQDEILDAEEDDSTNGHQEKRAIEYISEILLTSRAKEQDPETGRDKYNTKGDIILTKDYDITMGSKEKFEAGSDLVMFVNDEWIQEFITNKRKTLSANNIPIAVMPLEDFNGEKRPYVSIRDLDNKNWSKMEPGALKKTQEVRQKIFDAYSKDKNVKFYTKSTAKDGGRTNKSKSFKPLKEALFIKDKGYIGVSIASADNTRKIPLKDGSYAINPDTPPGMTTLVIDNANGDKVGIPVDISEIKHNDNQDEYVNTTFEIIMGYINNQDELGDIDIHTELNKYFHTLKYVDAGIQGQKTHPSYDEISELRSEQKANDQNLTKYKFNNVFGLTQIDDDYKVYLPNSKGYKLYNISKTANGLDITSPSVVGGKVVQEKISLAKFKNEFKNRTSELYPNIVDKYGQDPENFDRLELKDGKIVRTESGHYFDFLSDMADIKTRVSPVHNKAGVFYTAQPNVQIDNNIKTQEEFDAEKETPANVSDVVVEEGAKQLEEASVSNDNEAARIYNEKNDKINKLVENREKELGRKLNNDELTPYSIMWGKIHDDYIKSYSGAEISVVENKEGVVNVFKENPELSKIGTEQQYSEYIKTIFPESKVKDIVYHGSLKKDPTSEFNRSRNDIVFFALNKNDASPQKFITTAIVNLIKPAESLAEFELFRDKHDIKGYIDTTGARSISEVAVVDNSNIHILGSKKDIQGFKDFVGAENASIAPAIDLFEDFDDNGDFGDDLEAPFSKLEDIVDYNNASLASFSHMKSIDAEEQVITSMLGFLLKYLDSQRASGLAVNIDTAIYGVLNSIKAKRDSFKKHSTSDIDLKQAKADGVSKDISINAKIASNMDVIIDHFEESFNEDGSVKFVGYKKRLEVAYRTLSFVSAEETEENVIDTGENEKTRHIEGANYKTDPEKSMSAQIKRLLTEIPMKTAKGATSLNIIGQPKFVEFGVAFNYLMENLSNIAVEDIIGELESLSSGNYIAQGILNKLNQIRSKNPDIMNKFISVTKKQKAKFFSVILDIQKDKLGSKAVGKITENNKTGSKDIIRSRWASMYFENGMKIGLLRESKGSIQINKKEAKKVNKAFVKATNSIKSEAEKQGVIDVFKNIGVSLSMEALNKLQGDYSNRKYKKYFKEMFGKAANQNTFELFIKDAYGYIFSDLQKELDPYSTQSGRIDTMAIYEQKFDLDATSQSFRNAAGDMIYSFVNPHHLSNTVDSLRSNENFRKKFENDSFSKHSTWLSNPESIELAYYDASKSSQKGSLAKEYQDQNDFEKEVTKVNLYLNAGNAIKSWFFTPSPSDKTTFSMIKADRIDTSDVKFKDGKVQMSSQIKEQLFDLLIQSEVDRINQTVSDFEAANNIKDKEAKNSALNKLMDGYHHKNGHVGSGAFFFMIPSLNDIIIREANGSIDLNKLNTDAAMTELENYFSNTIDKKLGSWRESGILKSLDTKSVSNRKGLNNLAVEYVINSATSYANQYMLLTGDPARFGKIRGKYEADFNDWKSVLSSTLPNMFKRIAKDIAPGIEGNFAGDKSYTIAIMEEPIKSSDLANGNEKSPYANIDLADAQEWTTLDEHINVLMAYGRLTEPQKKTILENRDNLTWEQIGIVLQPLKPVQVLEAGNDSFGAITDYYIKTSSFPLITQLTKGFPQLEKMQAFMEDNNIDRMVPPTAVKLGGHKTTKLFEDGNFIENNEFDDSKKITLDRDGFRIQQDVPFSRTKSKIGEGSQLRKLMFGDVEPSFNFKLNGENISGKELKELSDKIHSTFYGRKFDKLTKSLKVDENFKIQDLNKLRDLMVAEALDRGFGHNDVLMLNTMKLDNGRIVFDIPLFFNPMVHKIESLLNSVIKNKVLKIKLPGKSYVQGSSLGFQAKTEDFIKSIAGKDNGVILTKDYKGELDYREDKDGLYSEVFLPSHFQGVDLTQYIGKDGLLDISKIDPKLLEMVGYRIPTQGFNSMIRLKVVGLLPEVAGDLIIVPPAMAVQMGSDFDVDKLYVHKYNYVKNDNGRLSYDTPSGDISSMTDEQLQNHLIDVYQAILSNKEVGEMAKAPLDNDDVAEVIKEIEGLTSEFSDGGKVEYSTINDDLHTRMIDTQAAGQIGIGITSVASTFHALAQWSGLYIKPKKTKGEKPKYHSVRFSLKSNEDNAFSDHGNLNENKSEKGSTFTPKGNTSNTDVNYGQHAFKGAFRMDKIYGFSKSGGQFKRISDVIKNIQTESVDNANNGRLYGMNLNKNTFGVAMLMARTGFDEKIIGYYLNQPIIKEYVARLRSLNNYTETEFVKNKKEVMQAELLKELGYTEVIGDIEIENISLEEMTDGIINGDIATEFQRKVLKNFLVYEEIAVDLQKAQAVLNVDTKFLGSNIAGIVNRSNNFTPNLINSNFFGNTENLYYGTTAGSAYDHGVDGALKLYGTQNLLPYDSDSMKEVFKSISKLTERDLTDSDIEEISIGIRSSMWGDIMENTFPGIGSIYEKRKSLAFGDNNLAKRVVQAKNKYPNNSFLQSLNPKEPFNTNEPVSIDHVSSKDANNSYDYRKQIAWLDLLNSPKDSEQYNLGFDLFVWSVTFGTERTARDFGRFIPNDFIRKSGLAENLRDIDFQSAGTVNKLNSNFIRQYFQHYPNKLPSLGGGKENLITPDKITPRLMKLPDGEVVSERFSHEFVKIFNPSSKKTNVYELEDGIYIKRDSLGFGTFTTEFNLSKEIAETIMPTNPKGVKYEPTTKFNKESAVVEDQHTGEFLLEDYGFDHGLDTVLDRINESNTKYMDVANYYLNKLDTIPGYRLERYDSENPIHRNPAEDPENVRGRLIRTRDGAPVHVMAIDPTNALDDLHFQETIIHETTHAFTLGMFATPDNQLSEKQVESKKKLNDLYAQYLNISYDIRNQKGARNASINVNEFIAEAMSNSKVQEILNNTKAQNTTLWEKFKKLVIELFGDVKKGSLLEATLNEVLNAIDLQVEVTVGSGVEAVNQIFSQEDIEEANNIKEYCKGLSGKNKGSKLFKN